MALPAKRSHLMTKNPHSLQTSANQFGFLFYWVSFSKHGPNEGLTREPPLPPIFKSSNQPPADTTQDVSIVWTVSSSTSMSRAVTFSVRTAVVPFSHRYRPNLGRRK